MKVQGVISSITMEKNDFFSKIMAASQKPPRTVAKEKATRIGCPNYD